MSKAIKVDEIAYYNLDRLRGKGETFSEVVEDLLSLRELICSHLAEIEHLLRFWEYQREQSDKPSSKD